MDLGREEAGERKWEGRREGKCSPDVICERIIEDKCEGVVHTPLIPTLGKKKQVDLCEVRINQGYIVSFRAARATQ